MGAVAPQVKTVEQPVQFLDVQDDGFVGGVGRGFETLGFQALEPKTEAVALPIEDFHSVTGAIQKNEKYRVEDRHLDIQLDQGGQAVDGLSEVHGFGVEVDFFDFGVGTHHEVLAPERDRERSIELQWAALNVWVMDRLQTKPLPASADRGFGI